MAALGACFPSQSSNVIQIGKSIIITYLYVVDSLGLIEIDQSHTVIVRALHCPLHTCSLQSLQLQLDQSKIVVILM